MGKITYSEAQPKDSDNFNDFMQDFFDGVTTIQDPGTPDGTLADLTEKFNSLIAAMKANGLMR
jgi:hypothetical protein